MSCLAAYLALITIQSVVISVVFSVVLIVVITIQGHCLATVYERYKEIKMVKKNLIELHTN